LGDAGPGVRYGMTRKNDEKLVASAEYGEAAPVTFAQGPDARRALWRIPMDYCNLIVFPVACADTIGKPAKPAL
jgi:hypothetical protein